MFRFTPRDAHSIEDLAGAAKRRLPRIVFDYLDGAAEAEVTACANRRAFERIRLQPRILTGAARPDLSISLFGQTLSAPFLFGPTGLNGIFWPKGDSILARVAARSGVGFCTSTAANETLETVAQAGQGPRFFQLYTWGEREDWAGLMRRAHDAGYQGLIVTCDSLVAGNRLRDKRNKFAHSVTITPKTVLDGLLHPAWLFGTWFANGVPRLENIADRLPPGSSAKALAAYTRNQRSEGLCWDDIRWIREQWQGPLLIKGVLHAHDALAAKACGAEGVVISNHGGRALDTVPPTIELLPEIAAAVGGDLRLLIDSGFRRGTDIVKALALGADAVLLGRAPLYGLACAGEQGVEHAMTLLRSEVERTMSQLGCARVNDLSCEFVRAAPAWP